MKRNIFKALAIAAALLSSVITVYSQDYHSEGGVKTAKEVEGPDGNGNYTITLETFATGETTVKPLDIVLVLDRSGSMNDPYKPTEVRTWTRSDIQNSDITLYARRNSSSANYAYDYYQLRVRNNRIEGLNTLYTDWNRAQDFGTSLTEALYYDLKLPALKVAVNAFIAKIDEKDKLGGSKRIGNRISIVTFANDNADATLANWTYLGNSALDINNQTGYNNLTSSVNGITATGSTYVDDGINRANTLLGSARSNAVKVVVLFTDGVPGSGRWSNNSATTVANRAISLANTIKGADGKNATIWTVGLFEPMTDDEVSLTNTYMSRVSSNYLGVTNMTNSATAADTKYYIEVGDGDSLTDIFESVAEASATNLDATTQVRDEVSNSFVIPEGTEADDIEVYTSNVTGETSWGPLQSFDATISFFDKDGSVIDMDAEDHAAPKSIVVEGFDFGKPDTSVGAGDGHWVGQRYNTTSGYFWAGKKLVIKFKIKANGEATGGTGTPTNDPSSGVYRKNQDGTYTIINHYDQPHTTLTVNLKIMKSGLRAGESATFEIHKVRPKNWDENKDLETNIKAMEYNVIGKPVPGDNWDTHFGKVIITNKTQSDGAEVTKILYALDPYWVYRVVEDDWGWAYEMTGHTETSTGERVATTSDVELNPFTFENTEKTGVPKHAEAVTINHFGYTIVSGDFQGEQEEHYKSSKVESF